MRNESDPYMVLGSIVIRGASQIKTREDTPLELTVGVAVGTIISCALRNPRWAQWFLSLDEDQHRRIGSDPSEIDAELMEAINVEAVE